MIFTASMPWLLFCVLWFATLAVVIWGFKRQNLALISQYGLLLFFLWLVMAGLGWQSLKPKSIQQSQALIVTKGADEKAVRDLAIQLGRDTPVFLLPGAQKRSDLELVTVEITDTAWLARHYSDLQHWHLLGWGLDQADLNRLQPAKLTFHESEKPFGLRSASWPQRLQLGETLRFQGVLGAPAAQPLEASLVDPAGEIVSQQMIEAGSDRIALSTPVLANGGLNYRLRISTENDQLLEETIAVYVSEPQPMEVWAFLSAPRFEMKFLKNWLGESGSRIWIQTKMTDKEWHKDAINREALSSTWKNHSWQVPDIVIVDYQVLADLNSSELDQLSKAVEKGLGLFCFPQGLQEFTKNASPTHRKFFADWYLEWQEDGIELLQASVHWSGALQPPEKPIGVLPAELKLSKRQIPLMDNGFGVILAATASRGQGVIATSLVKNSQQWALNGDSAQFQAYWSKLLGAVSKPLAAKPTLAVDRPARVDSPIDWRVWANSLADFQIQQPAATAQISWQENHLKLGDRAGELWPTASGWQNSQWGGQKLQPFFVDHANSWTFQLANQRLENTRAHIRKHNLSAGNGSPQSHTSWRLWFIFALFCGCSVTWLGEKLGYF